MIVKLRKNLRRNKLDLISDNGCHKPVLKKAKNRFIGLRFHSLELKRLADYRKGLNMIELAHISGLTNNFKT